MKQRLDDMPAYMLRRPGPSARALAVLRKHLREDYGDEDEEEEQVNRRKEARKQAELIRSNRWTEKYLTCRAESPY